MDYNSLMKLKKAQLAEKVVGLQNDVAQLRAKLEAQPKPMSKMRARVKAKYEAKWREEAELEAKAQTKARELKLPADYWNDAFAKSMFKRKADPEAVFAWLKTRKYNVEIDGKIRHLHGRYVKNKMISLQVAS